MSLALAAMTEIGMAVVRIVRPLRGECQYASEGKKVLSGKTGRIIRGVPLQ